MPERGNIMPNHVVTILTAPKLVIEAITRSYRPEEIQAEKDELENLRNRELSEWFTANRKQGAIENREKRINAMMTDRITDFAMVIPEPENIETGGCNGEHEPGVVCWYHWNIENWGTKWNAYSTKIGASENGVTELRFESAWSHPYPVIEALSKKFPNVAIKVAYADEDLGYNLGKYSIKNGEHTDLLGTEDGSDEALEFAAQTHYGKTYAELQEEWGE